MKIGIILPDHGGRLELIKFAFKQIQRQTVTPDQIYYIDPLHIKPNESIDLVARLKMGYEFAKEDGMDFVFVWEDDFYGADYIERFLPYMHLDFVGQNYTTYYHLKNRTWRVFNGSDHKNRSSLFTTGFRLSALNNWNWDALRPDLAFVDIKLWEYARRRTKAFIDTGAIGMKHSIGRCAGKGHQMKFPNQDPEMEWLKSKVDEEAFQFYKSLSEKLCVTL
jgi:hypothetical protein